MAIYKILLQDVEGIQELALLEFDKELTKKELSDYVDNAITKVAEKGLRNKDEKIFQYNRKELKYSTIIEPTIEELKKIGFKEVKITAQKTYDYSESIYEHLPEKLRKEAEEYQTKIYEEYRKKREEERNK
jgi:hypothetical protein